MPRTSLGVPQAFISARKMPIKTEDTQSEPSSLKGTTIPTIQLPSSAHQDYSPAEINDNLVRHSTPPLTNTTHNLLINQDSGPLPSGWLVVIEHIYLT